MKNIPIIIGIILLFIFLSLNPLASSTIIGKNLDLNIEHISGFKINIINQRFFLWKQPETSIPDNGYPILFLFHGAVQHGFSWFLGFNQWSKSQTIFTAKALEEGFFIIAPDSLKPIRPGPRAWDIFNNVSNSKDIILIEDIIEWLENSDLPVDINSLYCAGFSSGAFMCSYIGHFFNNRFNAIAVHSGANSESISLTPNGPYFDLNGSYNFSSSFPPTIIIHGRNDSFVPIQSAENFYSDLQINHIPSKLLISQDEGHIWISQYDFEILDWFKTY
jgi:poly(3-hydroxybutyrate) depolymerase